MDIVGKRRIFLTVSAVATVIGLISIVLFGFKLSIEFTGGSKLEVTSTDNKAIDVNRLKQVFVQQKINVVTITKNSEKDVTVRTDQITDAQKNQVLAKATDGKINIKEKSFDTLGPIIGAETRNNAFKAVGLAILAITLYIAFAFRTVSKPVSPLPGISSRNANQVIKLVEVCLGIWSLLVSK